MAKFRITLGILLLFLGPTLFFMLLDAEQSGINLAKPDGTRGTALFDLLGKWGILAVCIIFGISEVNTGKALLRDNPAAKNKTLMTTQNKRQSKMTASVTSIQLT